MDTTALAQQFQSGIYAWRDTPGWNFVGDADEIGRHIEGIVEAKRGFVTTRDLLDDAHDTNSPLHPNVEWDDYKAAENWRLLTMRALVGSVVRVAVREIEGKETEINIRAFVNVVVDGDNYYTPISTVASNGQLKDQYVRRLSMEIQRWRSKAGDFQQFSGVISAIDALPMLPLNVDE